jgi:hypothetical protein
LGQPGLSHPEKLRFNRGKSILWVIIRTANEIQELAVKLGGRRGNNFQIGKHSVIKELLSDLTEQVPLSLVLDVVDGESSDNDIERSKRRQRIIQAPLPNANPIVAVESISGIPEHGWRRVHGYDALDVWAMFKNESGQPAVTATQVEHGAR